MNRMLDAVRAEIDRWKNIKILLLDIGIIAAFLVLVFGIWKLAENVVYEVNEGYSIGSLAVAVEREEYADLLIMCSQDYGNKEQKKEYQEFYALADYYQAASWYKVYLNAKNTERAAIQQEKMNAAEEKLGRLSATKNRVDARLGITENH